jgi:hypothetical protein
MIEMEQEKSDQQPVLRMAGATGNRKSRAEASEKDTCGKGEEDALTRKLQKERRAQKYGEHITTTKIDSMFARIAANGNINEN